MLSMSSGWPVPWLPSLPETPTLLPPHMGFTFGLTEHFLNVILWCIIWRHSLPVTNSRADTSWVSQGETFRFHQGELRPFNLTPFAPVIIYTAWSVIKIQAVLTWVLYCSSLWEPVGGVCFPPVLLPVVNRLCQRFVCMCVFLCVWVGEETEGEKFGGQAGSFR